MFPKLKIFVAALFGIELTHDRDGFLLAHQVSDGDFYGVRRKIWYLPNGIQIAADRRESSWVMSLWYGQKIITVNYTKQAWLGLSPELINKAITFFASIEKKAISLPYLKGFSLCCVCGEVCRRSAGFSCYSAGDNFVCQSCCDSHNTDGKCSKGDRRCLVNYPYL